MNTLGVVLCGGKSSRMGTDKGLILSGNLTWAEKAYVKLSLLSIPVVVSVNSGQTQLYHQFFSPDLLIEDGFSIGGPLNGILSVHQQYPEKDLFLLACDMIRMDGSILQKLFDAFILHKNKYDFFLFKNQDMPEPLCCIYSSKSLKRISQEVKEGSIQRFSLKGILTSGTCFFMEPDNTETVCFSNINEPHQLSMGHTI